MGGDNEEDDVIWITFIVDMEQGKGKKDPTGFICAGSCCGFPECVRCPHYHDPEICRFSPMESIVSEVTKVTPQKLFCGGTFCFDYRNDGYEIMATKDYRAKVLGSVELLLRPKNTDGLKINDNLVYVGPFYFETESMKAEDIICSEKKMIESCTDAIFLLDAAACPGTIAEMMYANSLQKTLHLFYVRNSDDEETESGLHTPCWYPLHFCQMTNKSVNLYPCSCVEDAADKILSLVESLER